MFSLNAASFILHLDRCTVQADKVRAPFVVICECRPAVRSNFSRMGAVLRLCFVIGMELSWTPFRALVADSHSPTGFSLKCTLTLLFVYFV